MGQVNIRTKIFNPLRATATFIPSLLWAHICAQHNVLFVCTQSSFLLTPDIHPGTFLYTSIHRGYVTNEYATVFHEKILYFLSFSVTVFTVKQKGVTMDAAGSILEDFRGF